jgi:1-acyl-sn-glycerol-3-phosphate acyltransferase
LERGRRILKRLSRYHQHRAVGLEHIPDGPALLVVNHSLATYDIGLLVLAIYEHTGRIVRGLGDRAIFRTPWIRSLASRAGVVQGSPAHAEELLAQNQLVLVAPGGMMEALRSSDEKYRIMWARRRGFLKVAIRNQVPIVLAACPNADDIYSVYESSFTKRVYEYFRMPAPLCRGVGPTLWPRKVQLTHFLSEPIDPPGSETADDSPEFASFHGHVCCEMNELMATSLSIT